MDENKEEIKALDENQTDSVAGGDMTLEEMRRRVEQIILEKQEKTPMVTAYGGREWDKPFCLSPEQLRILRENLNEMELENVSGGVGGGTIGGDAGVVGMPNPVSGLSFAEALKKAKEFGPHRKDMGTWMQMNEKDYMRWWKDSNKDEYLKHQKDVDNFLNA